MEKFKISLVDNDFVVHARTDLSERHESDSLIGLIRHLDEDFIAGETAFLEVDGPRKLTRYVISRVEAE